MSSILREALDSLFPRKHRAPAIVAAIRTFEQTIRSNLTVGAGGVVVVTASDLMAIDWSAVLWVLAALLLSALLSAYIAFTDVARHGVSSKYAEALARDAADAQTAALPATVTPVSPFALVEADQAPKDPNTV